MANEAFAHVEIDQFLKDTDWRLTDGRSVPCKCPLDDGSKADSALFDRQGRALAVLEAESTRFNLSAGEVQELRYAGQFDVPFIFLSAGEEVHSYGRRNGRHPAKTAPRIHRRRHCWDVRVNSTSLHTEGRFGAVGGNLRWRAANA